MRFVTKCFLILLLALSSGWVGASSPTSTEPLPTRSLDIEVFVRSQHRLQEKEGRWLKLISGVVTVGLGIYLLLLH